MYFKNIKFIFFVLQIFRSLELIQSDHVKVIRCAQEAKCLENLNWNLLKVIEENQANYSEPCENFWLYACGSWTAAPYYDHVDNFEAIANYYADNLKEKLNEWQSNRMDQKYETIAELVQQILLYYKSCLNSGEYYLNMAGYLNNIPFKDIWDQNLYSDSENIWQNINWFKMLALLRRYGFNEVFLKESVGFAANNSTQYVLHLKIAQASATFKNKYHVLHIMKEFNLVFSNQTKNYWQLAQNIYEFDNELQDLDKKYQHIKQEYFMTLQDLQFLAPNLNWSLYFGLLLNQQLPPKTPVEFSGNLSHFQDLLILIEQKPKDILGLYILLRFCQYLLDIRPLITDRECLLHTNLMFPLGLNYIYDQFLYKNRIEDEYVLQTIFLQLKEQFSSIINDNKFSLKPREIKYLENKLNKMQIRIGNLPLKIQNINNYYATAARLTLNNFYHNHLEMLKFRTIQQHEQLLQSFFNIKTFYINDDISQLRNAPYFIHQRNILIIPMLFLQLPFYHHSQHPVFQYSLVGWIMAHEMSHGFDAHGLQFDAEGNKSLMGLQLSRNPLFLTAIECLTRNAPTISLNERLADVNGLQLAWQTFRHQVITSQEQDEQYFFDQLFFINFAQFFCGSLPRPIDHDRDDVRVKQTVGNMNEFSQVFQCPKENLVEKCNIWRK